MFICMWCSRCKVFEITDLYLLYVGLKVTIEVFRSRCNAFLLALVRVRPYSDLNVNIIVHDFKISMDFLADSVDQLMIVM